MNREVCYEAAGTSKIVFLCICLLLAMPLVSQDRAPKMQQFPEVKHASTIPLRDIKVVPPQTTDPEPEENASARTRETQVPVARNTASSLSIQSAMMAPLSVTPGLNFEGVDSDHTRATPDTNGAVGATQYVQWVNVSFKVFDKTNGNLLLGPIYGTTLWTGFGGPC